jgi:5,10-methenyltetrahydromethanopterin hydrogenase
LRSAAIIGVIACVVWIAWLARKDTTIRLAFDNRGYPPGIVVQFWLDDATEGALIHATCTIDHCETAPMLMDKGGHRIRLRVLVDGQASAFTVTTIER